MNSVGKLVLGVATLGVLVFSVCRLARAQNETYQHVPLPAELPKGVSVQAAQELQSVIDEYRRQEPLMVTKIKGNIYLAKGGSAGNDPNVGFVVGKTSVIVLDSKNKPDSEKDVVAEIAKITSKPVKTVILLHTEHQAGVAGLPAGITVIAQENVRKETEASTAADRVPSDYLPTKTIDKDETMTIDGVRVRLIHWAPGYTNGDMVAYFPDQRVVFASDLVVNDFPLGATVIDRKMNGSVSGWMENIRGMLALNSDIYVSGHGPIFTKPEVRTQLAFIQDKWDKIKVMVAQGKSIDEVNAAIGGPKERTPSTTENIYAELKAK